MTEKPTATVLAAERLLSEDRSRPIAVMAVVAISLEIAPFLAMEFYTIREVRRAEASTSVSFCSRRPCRAKQLSPPLCSRELQEHSCC